MGRTPGFSALQRASSGWIDRRAFLRGLAAYAAASSVGDEAIAADPPSGPRVGIVGAGLAGLHCAVRLKEAGVVATVLEASDRPGGRVWSGRGLFPDDQVCELGGELIDSNHATLRSLCEQYALPLDDRTIDALPDQWHLGGKLVPHDVVMAQFEGLKPTIARHFAAAERSNQSFATLDAQPLSTWIANNVAGAELAAALAVTYVGEFGLEVAEQSALNLIYLVGNPGPDTGLYGLSDERWHVRGGNDRLTSALAAELDPDQLMYGTRVTGIRAAPRGSGSPGGFVVTAEATGVVEHTFDRVVIAVPFSVVRGWDLSGVKLKADKRACIDTLGYGTNAKLMIGFSGKPWRDAGASGMLESEDAELQSTWDSSIGQPGPSGILTNFLGGVRGVTVGEGTAEEQATAAVRRLHPIWPAVGTQRVTGAARLHWPSRHLAKGSYACYRPGQWAFWGVEGRREGALHFCGEHTSREWTGWMEGAAETGARAAAEVLDALDIPRPPRLQSLLDLLEPA